MCWDFHDFRRPLPIGISRQSAPPRRPRLIVTVTIPGPGVQVTFSTVWLTPRFP